MINALVLVSVDHKNADPSVESEVSENCLFIYNTMKNRYKINELLDLDTVENKNNVYRAENIFTFGK